MAAMVLGAARSLGLGAHGARPSIRSTRATARAVSNRRVAATANGGHETRIFRHGVVSREASFSTTATMTRRVTRVTTAGAATLNAPTTSFDDQIAGDGGKSLRVACYISVWYFLNAVFAIVNKRTLGVFPHFWLLSWTQIGVGAAFTAITWRLRAIIAPTKARTNDGDGFRWNRRAIVDLAPTSAYHLVAHCTACASYALGSVSFFMLVKAAEPACAVLLTSAFFKRRYSKAVWLTMIPIVGGVALGSASELNFSFASFACAMLSNVASALRSATSKDAQARTGLGGADLYGAMSVVGAIALLPVSLVMEGGDARGAYAAAKAQMVARDVRLCPGVETAATPFLVYLLVGGLLFHLYNQTSYRALGELQPLDISVANAVKRVVIILASVAVLKNPITPLGGVSAAVAIAGTFAYSLAAQKQCAEEAAAGEAE